MERGSARQFSSKGQEGAIISQTNIGTISKATLGKLLRDGVESIWAFPSTEITSRTELNCGCTLFWGVGGGVPRTVAGRRLTHGQRLTDLWPACG